MRNEREKGMYILCKLGGANNISTFTTILLAKCMNEYMRDSTQIKMRIELAMEEEQELWKEWYAI